MNSVQIMLGAEGIKLAYNDSLQQETIDIVCMSEGYDSVINNYFTDQFVPRVYGKLKTREIVPDTAANRTDAAQKPAMNTVRFLKDAPKSESDFLLGRDRAVFISLGTTDMDVVVLEHEVVKSLK